MGCWLDDGLLVIVTVVCGCVVYGWWLMVEGVCLRLMLSKLTIIVILKIY